MRAPGQCSALTCAHVLPACAQHLSGYDLYFAMARGVPGTEALDMSKFFDTNYHYLVPELAATVSPKPDFSFLLEKARPCARTCMAGCVPSAALIEDAWLASLHLAPCWVCIPLHAGSKSMGFRTG
jgi:hypothetical protein